ncbi:MAG: hypothetical protein JWM97_1406 [Phycisphaerales bacterium]|nr:hypothetical protein [Phycisphaerales bacterium]
MLESVAEVLFVADIRSSRDWYVQFLGRGPAEDLPDFVSFAMGGQCLSLHRADEKSPAGPRGGGVAYWNVGDFDAAMAKARSLGGAVYRGPIRLPDGWRICQIMDPFGNVIRVQGHQVGCQAWRAHRRAA